MGKGNPIGKTVDSFFASHTLLVILGLVVLAGLLYGAAWYYNQRGWVAEQWRSKVVKDVALRGTRYVGLPPMMAGQQAEDHVNKMYEKYCHVDLLLQVQCEFPELE